MADDLKEMNKFMVSVSEEDSKEFLQEDDMMLRVNVSNYSNPFNIHPMLLNSRFFRKEVLEDTDVFKSGNFGNKRKSTSL